MAFKMKGFPKHKVKSPTKHTPKDNPRHVKDDPHIHMEGIKAVKQSKSPAKADGRQGKLKKGKLLKSEMEGTAVTGGSKIEQINDLEDRIGFIKEDIFNQKEGATAKQNKDIAAMEKRISKIKASMERGKGSYGKEEYDKE